MFPVLLVFLAAVIEFGLVLGHWKYVEYSARMGAKVAAELSNADLSSGTDADNVDEVRTAVDRVLAGVGMSSCQVILEHNADCVTPTPDTKDSGACSPCSAPAASLPDNTTEVPGGVVRVTVCVPMTDLSPDLLSTLGFSLSGRVARASTTFPYENCDP